MRWSDPVNFVCLSIAFGALGFALSWIPTVLRRIHDVPGNLELKRYAEMRAEIDALRASVVVDES